jgi:hypothetical protein
MKLESAINIDESGIAKSVATIDMSKFITIMEAFWTGGNASGIDKDLCKDENFSGGLYESLSESKEVLTDVKCTSLWAYIAKVQWTQDLSQKKWILMLSGVTILDMLALWDENRVPKNDWNDDFSSTSAEEMGFSIHQSYTVPGTIVYKEAGNLSGSSTIELNLLDPKILKKQSLILISTKDGRKLTTREINAYKLKLRKHNRSIR